MHHKYAYIDSEKLALANTVHVPSRSGTAGQHYYYERLGQAAPRPGVTLQDVTVHPPAAAGGTGHAQDG